MGVLLRSGRNLPTWWHERIRRCRRARGPRRPGAGATGQLLTPEVWARRHRGIVWLLWLHVGGVVVFALLRGKSLGHALTEVTPMVVAALAASLPALGRRARSTAAVLGLVTASAVIVHLSGGAIEAHFHFFVMIRVITLYPAS